jgi:hypothetical protein
MDSKPDEKGSNVIFSKATLRQAKRAKIPSEELEKNYDLRIRVINDAFERLRQKLLVRAGFETPECEAGLVDLKSRTKGRVVALLSSGEPGIIIEETGRKFLVKLDKDDTKLKLCRDDLFWLKGCTGPDDAVVQIYEACKDVPHPSDIRMGMRVSLTKWNYMTGVVEQLPGSRANAAFIVRIEHSGTVVRARAETLRLIPAQHPLIGPLFDKAGRPSKKEARRRKRERKPVVIVPPSKASLAWKSSLKPPKTLPPPLPAKNRAAGDSGSDSDEDEDASDDEGNFSDEVDEENVTDNKTRQTEFLL